MLLVGLQQVRVSRKRLDNYISNDEGQETHNSLAELRVLLKEAFAFPAFRSIETRSRKDSLPSHSRVAAVGDCVPLLHWRTGQTAKGTPTILLVTRDHTFD